MELTQYESNLVKQKIRTPTWSNKTIDSNQNFTVLHISTVTNHLSNKTDTNIVQQDEFEILLYFK